MRAVVVVDDFLNDAEAARAHALTLAFDMRSASHPGARTRGFADAGWIPSLERYLGGERITVSSYNGAYQMCLEDDGDSWIHRDATDWAAVLFLTPNAPPDAGLTLYRHRASRALGTAGLRPEDVSKLDRDARVPERWEVSSTIGNVFNRLVLFRGSQFHKSSRYFGASADTGRLTKVLFFDAVVAPAKKKCDVKKMCVRYTA